MPPAFRVIKRGLPEDSPFTDISDDFSQPSTAISIWGFSRKTRPLGAGEAELHPFAVHEQLQRQHGDEPPGGRGNRL